MEGQHCGRGVRMQGGRGRGQNRGRGRRGQIHRQIPNEIRATVVDHVVNHGLTMAEAGRRVQPNVGRTTVNSIIQTFRRENRYVQYWTVIQHLIMSHVYCTLLSFHSAPHRIERQPCRGGRGPLFTLQQEEAICSMVIANNAIRLKEIQSAVIKDSNVFGNIESVSIATTECSREMKCG